MKVPCRDLYSQNARPSAETLLRFQQLQKRNRFKRYYLEVLPRFVANVLFLVLWDEVPPSLKLD